MSEKTMKKVLNDMIKGLHAISTSDISKFVPNARFVLLDEVQPTFDIICEENEKLKEENAMLEAKLLVEAGIIEGNPINDENRESALITKKLSAFSELIRGIKWIKATFEAYNPTEDSPEHVQEIFEIVTDRENRIVEKFDDEKNESKNFPNSFDKSVFKPWWRIEKMIGSGYDVKSIDYYTMEIDPFVEIKRLTKIIESARKHHAIPCDVETKNNKFHVDKGMTISMVENAKKMTESIPSNITMKEAERQIDLAIKESADKGLVRVQGNPSKIQCVKCGGLDVNCPVCKGTGEQVLKKR